MRIVIKNRKHQKLVVVLEKVQQAKGLAFVMHGLGGSKDQPHIQTFADAFNEKGYTVVRFDTTNTFGESDGNYEDATTTNYYEDLEDVIAWASKEDWYQEPFCLAGHSLGGISTALYAEKNPQKVKALAPISTVVSGELSLVAHGKAEIDRWEQTGWKEEASVSKPGLIKRLKWQHMEDRLTHDLLPNAHKLSMPVLLIVGAEDTVTLPEHQQMLFEKLPGQKELHTINNAPHTFTDPKQLSEIKNIFLQWIDNIS